MNIQFSGIIKREERNISEFPLHALAFLAFHDSLFNAEIDTPGAGVETGGSENAKLLSMNQNKIWLISVRT